MNIREISIKFSTEEQCLAYIESNEIGRMALSAALTAEIRTSSEVRAAKDRAKAPEARRGTCTQGQAQSSPVVLYLLELGLPQAVLPDVWDAVC